MSSLRRDLPCQNVVELVTDYLEGALSRASRIRFDHHLAGCPDCTEYVAQIRATIHLTGKVEVEAPSSDMRTELINRYRRWQAESQ